jgi:vacuolar-type H+-ATPase subunit C/Vma6
MYEYGNARIAALRSRLLGPATLAGLAESATATVFLATLDRSEDWRPVVRQVGPLVADSTAVEAAIERHRTSRLGALPGWYPGSARALVEALVLPLDRERIVALLRRRHAGEDGETVSASIVGGAVLDGPALGRVARAPTLANAITELIDLDVVLAPDAPRLRALAADISLWPSLEAALVEAIEHARLARASGRGSEAATVRRSIGEEARIRSFVLDELEASGLAAASALDRFETLRRLDRLAAVGRRDPLGVGAVAGYVAAIEAQAIRLRAALARTASGWSVGQQAPYRVTGGD